MASSKPREVYLPTHIIQCNERSACPYYEVVQFGKEPEVVCIAYCKATSRYLARSFVKKCIMYWEACPFKHVLDFQPA